MIIMKGRKKVRGMMKKKLADEIGEAFVRLHCSHFYWYRESPLIMGSFSRGVIVCANCGKKKFIEQLNDSEVIVGPWRVNKHTSGAKMAESEDKKC